MTLTVAVRAARSRDDRAWQEAMPVSSLLIARCAAMIPVGAVAKGLMVKTYDGVLDGAITAGTAARIADDMIALARDSDVDRIIYLTGAFGAIGDTVVEHLASSASIVSVGGDLPPIAGPTTIVDALALAEARAIAPFDAGLLALDSGATTVVTNWCGAGVIAAATSVLAARLGVTDLPTESADGYIVIPKAQHAEASASITGLRQIYARLRRPDGCPWDREQTESTTLEYVNEEVEELRQALANNDAPNAAEELGDILGNVLMVAQIAEEHGLFTFEDAVQALSEKLVRRHPHVFGSEQAASPDDVLKIWNRVKQQEQQSTVGGGSTNA